jgi:hypothetical protein
VQNNVVRLERLTEADNLDIEGIRIWGVLGGRMMVAHNHLFSHDGNQKRSFLYGIHVTPLADNRPPSAQWVVMWNVAPSQRATVLVSNGAVNLNGTNVP